MSHYEGRGVRTNRLDDDAHCVICGARATNSHHVPAVGVGGGNGQFQLGGMVLKPALIALCGSGTTGCHGRAHQGILQFRWVWDTEEYARDWWNGKLLEEYRPHDERLYYFGHWVISGCGDDWTYRGIR